MTRDSLFHKIFKNVFGRSEEVFEPRIREFNVKTDLEPILSWQEDLFTTNFAGFQMNPYFLKEQRRRLSEAALRPFEHGIFVLEHIPGKIGGFIWCKIYDTNEYGIFGSVEQIYLIPELRGKGFGKKLMEKGEEYFAERGAQSIKLLVTISNSAAVSLYQSLGYKATRWEMQKDVKRTQMNGG
ncbi:MAG: GNAT family N-acetyltransferase [Bacillota bacterium]|jgi:ribosomal protein S18 acetylase RimI-like enzyme|nr:GNAT family N-acetyltransferase [Bacillota bacterium]NLU54454.1 GNAT family N-acetyltransferase [Bacillota bacterium]HOJ45836.1 GNAT family N-acetyltransferase [Bacillota bacterium]HOP54905.1 GNAT family N-acetyltransferase [Bacillota bacterium]